MTAEYEVRLAQDVGEGGTEDHLRALLGWVREDEALARDARGSLTSSFRPSPGQMGNGLDLLALAIGTTVSTASLVFSVLQWQAARRPAPTVILRRGGVEVRLLADQAHDQEALRRIAGILDQQDGQSQEPEGR
ncbi:hypothetical protein NKH18_07940 [Streptomyces sp. M10(2022)]